MATEPTERSLGQLVAQATSDLSEITRAEIALAKAEIRADVKQGAMAGGMFGAAGFLLVLASVLLSVAAAFGLTALGLAPGWAFLVVAVVYLLLAAVLGLVGRSRVRRVGGTPERAIRTTKQTIATVKHGSRTP